MPAVMTSPPDATHVRGRTYKVTVDKHHRPAQLPRRSVGLLYYGEVTTENASEFNVMFVRDDLVTRLEALASQGDPDGSDLSFNQLLSRVVTCLEDQDLPKDSWLPDKFDGPDDDGMVLVIHNVATSPIPAASYDEDRP